MTRSSVITKWVQVQTDIGPMWRAKCRADLGVYPVPMSGGFQGDPLSGSCYCEIETDDPTSLEAHPDTVILHAVDVDEQGNETPRSVLSRAVTETKLLAIGMSQRDVDGLQNWGDRERLAEEVKALVR